MGQDPRTDGSPVTGSREPEEIRQDIEASRNELGDTVAALAEKADVKARAKERAQEVKHQARERVTGVKDSVVGTAKHASPDGAASAATQVSAKARENPLPVAAIGAFAAGIVVGRLLKR